MFLTQARISRNELAIGPARSQERQSQLERLWKMNFPDLHLHLSRAEKEKWFQWASRLKEGKSFFCSALGKVDAPAKLVRQLAASGADTNDPEVIKKAYSDAAKRLRDGWKRSPEEHLAPEKQRARAMGRVALPALPNCEGSEAFVWSSGNVRFYWKNPEHKVIAFTIPGSRTFLPSEAGEKRYISFVAKGINLVGSFGEVLVQPRSEGPPTWSKTQLLQSEQHEELKACWELHTAEEWRDDVGALAPIPDDYVALPASYYEPVGPPPLKQKQKNKDLYSQPPRPGDGTWIVNEFLNDFFGDAGGRLFSGNQEAFIKYEPEHVRVQLKAFVLRSKYFHYPWRSKWIGLLDDTSPQSTTHIGENIQFCREIIQRKNVTIGGGIVDGKQKNYTGKFWQIGPRKEGW